MFVILAVVLVVLWIVALVTSNTMGGLVHGLLLVAVVVLLLRLYRGRP